MQTEELPLAAKVKQLHISIFSKIQTLGEISCVQFDYLLNIDET